jgi:lactoylglutathione lyase
MIRYVKFVNLPVRDQQRALGFYRDVLGFTVETDVPYTEGGGRWIEIGIPGAETRLVFVSRDNDQVPAQPTVILVSDDVQGDYGKLTAKGVTFTTPPTETPWEKGAFYALFLDTENNLLMIGNS